MIRLIIFLMLALLTLSFCSHSINQDKKGDSIYRLKITGDITSSVKSTLFSLVDSASNQAQQPVSYIGECFLLDSGEVMLYDRVRGNLVDSISNDYPMEDYYEIRIIKQHDDWFKIKANAINKEKLGWVSIKPNCFGVYAANYTDVLTIYEEPAKESRMVHTFPEYFTEPFAVLGCKRGWIQVVLKKDHQIYKGWVPKELTCPNPYSTCN